MGLLDMLLNQGSPLSIANGGPVPINPLATPQSKLHGAGGTQAGYSTTGVGGTQLIIDFNSYVDGVNNSLPQPSKLDIENGVINTPQYNFTQTYLPGNQYTNVVGEAAPPTSPLVNTFDDTDLDLENGGPINDLVTQYSSPWLSGTPTDTANPGPLTNFVQNYVPNNQYASNITLNNSPLAETLSKTNLDIENSGVDGGPNADIITNYPATVTGTPTLTANPGGSPTNFSQPYIPTNQYISNVSLTNSPLAGILPITNLDVEDSGVQGGPNSDIITNYPATVTGTPTLTANPGGPPTNFSQPYVPNNQYINNISLTNSPLASTLPITNLDVEDSGVNGGPNSDIITNYPSTVTGTPTLTANPGGPTTNFSQPYVPNNQYISNVNLTNSPLAETLPITNLDVEDSGVNGGPNSDIITNYPATVTGTPTLTANPGGPPINFTPLYVPANQYINNISLNNSPLAGILPITNLDVEDSGVNGGPNNDIVTVYPPTVTGTPTLTANPGGPTTNFSQPYVPNNQYINNISLTNSPLAETLPITNLDVENSGVNGGPNSDIITVYPPTSTGTPGSGSHFWTYAGGTYPIASRFNHLYTPNNPYNISVLNSNLVNTLQITNYDVEDPGSDGGIPYKTGRDATVYPITTNGSTPNRGYFSTPSKPSSKYGTNNVFLPSNTYMNYIQPFI